MYSLSDLVQALKMAESCRLRLDCLSMELGME